MKRYIFVLTMLMMISACNPQAVTLSTNTPYPTDTPYPTYTPFPTWTLVPTAEPTSIAIQEPTATPLAYVPTHMPEITPVFINAKARNGLGLQEQNGITVEFYRIILANYKGLDSDLKNFLSEYSDFPAIIQPVFKIYNNTDDPIDHFDLNRFFIVVNGEQTSLTREAMYNYLLSNPAAGVLPHSFSSTGIWAGVGSTPWNEINEITVVFPKAIGSDGKPMTEDFIFKIPVGDWGWEPIQPK